MLSPELRSDRTLTVLALVLAVASWLDVIPSFALHYARLDHEHDGTPGAAFVVPGGSRRTFEDYVYLGLGFQTTFGTTDVDLVTPTVRQAAAGHTLIAFLFNTVILATVVSLAVATT